MTDNFLDIVDQNDAIIDRALYADVHKKGLWHREVHVWFITPDKKIVFQKRLPLPPHYPLPILDATAGGHVELGDSYGDTALKEVEEETGLKLQPNDLRLVAGPTKIMEEFPKPGGWTKLNNIFRPVYSYGFSGDLADLAIEKEAGAGFVALSLDELSDKVALEKQYCTIPYLMSDEMMALYKVIADVSSPGYSRRK